MKFAEQQKKRKRENIPSRYVHVLERERALGKERGGWRCKFSIIIHDLAFVLFMGLGGGELFYYLCIFQAGMALVKWFLYLYKVFV
jgi:hypothetical protein